MHTATTPTPSPRRRAAATLLVLALWACLTAVAAPAPGRADPAPTEARASANGKGADQAFLGYAIPRTKKASSGFIGSRRLGPTVVYRTDPRRTVPVGGFERAVWTSNFTASGGRPVGRARTACAAQLLSLGRTQTLPRLKRLQAAGIDVALQHLLHGGSFRHHGYAQRQRTEQVAKGSTIRAFAQNLIEDFCPLSGPYAVTLVADRQSVDLGGEVVYTAGVRSASGVPIANARLIITPATGTPILLRTDERGDAQLTVPASRPGPFSTSLVTRKLPQVQVRYLVPRRRGASRVAVAGLEQGDAYPRTRTTAVRARPGVTLDPDRPVKRDTAFRLRLGLRAGYPETRVAVLQVIGPRAGARDCSDGKVIRATRVTVSSNKPYTSPPLRLQRSGRYLWRVTVPGSTYNQRISTCGGGFAVTS